MTKESGYKPVERHKPTVDVSSVQNLPVDISRSNCSIHHSESAQGIPNGLRGTHNQENFKAPLYVQESNDLQFLTDKTQPATACVREKLVNRPNGPKWSSRSGFDHCENTFVVDETNSKNNLPRWQQDYVGKSSRSEQLRLTRHELLMKKEPSLHASTTRTSTIQENELQAQEQVSQQEPQGLAHQQIWTTQQNQRLETVKCVSHCQRKPPQIHFTHQHRPEKMKEAGSIGPELIRGQSPEAKISQPSDVTVKANLKVAQPYQEPAFNVGNDQRSGRGQGAILPPKDEDLQQKCANHQQRLESCRSHLTSMTSSCVDPNEQTSVEALRHQPLIIKEENVQQPRNLLPKLRVPSVLNNEGKLIQRQQFLQDKVKSRKMLLGTVIPSDISSSEPCRNWQLSAMSSRRYRLDINYKHAVLSGDSGVSMEEGSNPSRRNSEPETDDQAKDDLPTIIADVGDTVYRRVPSRCIKCQRTRLKRCETKEASSQHSHPPSETESLPSSPTTESIGSETIASISLHLTSPPPPNRVYQCRVVRDKQSYSNMFYPTYKMYRERNGIPDILLLTARKRKKTSTSKYVICAGNEKLRRKSPSLVGKLGSNLLGTRFQLSTYARDTGAEDIDRHSTSLLKTDSLLIYYETNFLGTKGPRRMKVYLPELGRDDPHLNILERVRDGSMNGVLSLVNKEPEWDRETMSHILYFEGRVTKSSVKNFQLIEPPDESSVLLQFGKISRNEFTLDYRSPINAVQAFAIALSSFDGKIACE